MENSEKYLRMARLAASRILGTAEPEQARQLDDWSEESPHNRELLDSVMSEGAFARYTPPVGERQTAQAWRRLEREMGAGKRRALRWCGAAAAVFVMAVAAFFVWHTRTGAAIEDAVVAEQIPSGASGARLVLDDGRAVALKPDSTFFLPQKQGTVVNKKAEGLDYRQAGDTPGQMCFNTLLTLTGMEYTVTLSDGTRVHLNAESRLRYPVSFGHGERRVEFSGEAYFEVARRQDQPFIVSAEGAEIEVLGTTFNVRSYPDETGTATTLVEGRVSVNGHHITPGQQAITARRSGLTEVTEADIARCTAWHSGIFMFRNEPLEEVMKTLKRWYGIEYRFTDGEAGRMRIGASFGRYRSMDPIIRMLEHTGKLEIELKDKTLNISMKKND